MPAALTSLLWLLLSLGPLLLLQRWLHREVQTIFLLLTRRSDLSITLFAVLFFPGVLLHEGSHYLAAKLLRVRTGRFSIIPHPLPGGRLQMGYVETAASDWVRDTLIGAAPLITGGLFVAYAGLQRLGLLEVWQAYDLGGWEAALAMIPQITAQSDFWLWFYLTLVVSSTMLPSASDRRAWMPLGLVILALLGASLLAGAGPWLEQNLAPLLSTLFLSVAVVFGISAGMHLLFVLPLWFLRSLLARLLGLEVTAV
jgi:hypothetical protein